VDSKGVTDTSLPLASQRTTQSAFALLRSLKPALSFFVQWRKNRPQNDFKKYDAVSDRYPPQGRYHNPGCVTQDLNRQSSQFPLFRLFAAEPAPQLPISAFKSHIFQHPGLPTTTLEPTFPAEDEDEEQIAGVGTDVSHPMLGAEGRNLDLRYALIHAAFRAPADYSLPPSPRPRHLQTFRVRNPNRTRQGMSPRILLLPTPNFLDLAASQHPSQPLTPQTPTCPRPAVLVVRYAVFDGDGNHR
jgi:hypothetical protein